MLRHLTARAMAPAGKAVAGLVPLLRPAAVRCASGAAAWAPPAQKQQAPAARGQQQRAQSYTYEPVASEASPEIGEADFDPAAANTGAWPPHSGVAAPPRRRTCCCAPGRPVRAPSVRRPTPAVRLIGVVGGKKELRVFERSKLLPFAIGVKLDRRRDETDWWAQQSASAALLAALLQQLQGCRIAQRRSCGAGMALPAACGCQPPQACPRIATSFCPCPAHPCLCRINVEAWGPLAERADAQLQKGDRIALQVCLLPPPAWLAYALPAAWMWRFMPPALIPAFPHCHPPRAPAQGRLKLDKWQDAATGAKRTAWKITASSISKVRSTYVPGAADAAQEAEAFGGYDEPAPAAASAAAPAPWDLPAEPAAAAQPGQAQGGAAMTAEEKWMDYFENPSREC